MSFELKKFVIFCVVVLCLLILPVSSTSFFAFQKVPNCEYQFFTDHITKEIEGAVEIQNGEKTIVCCNTQLSDKVRSELDKIYGESICIKNATEKQEQQIYDYIKDKIVKTENVDSIKIVYAYDSSIKNFVVVDGEKINVQFAKNGETITVGTPLILGSY